MKKDYFKSDVTNRIDRYNKKVLYEELKLREIEVRNSLYWFVLISFRSKKEFR